MVIGGEKYSGEEELDFFVATPATILPDPSLLVFACKLPSLEPNLLVFNCQQRLFAVRERSIDCH